MTDWYSFFSGRPNPGGHARVPVLDYLRDPDARPEVRRAGEASAAAQESARPPERPAWAPRTQPTKDLRAHASTPYAVGPGGVVAPSDVPMHVAQTEPQVEHVPLSVATGERTEPFGDDFARWYEATRGRPLPAALTALRQEPQSLDVPPENDGRTPNYEHNIPRGVEGGTVRVATRVERGVNDHAPTAEVDLPPIEGDLWDPERRAGIVPDFDPTQEWMAAEQRAFQRARERRPTLADLMIAIVMGNQAGRRSMDARELEDMRSDIRSASDRPSSGERR